MFVHDGFQDGKHEVPPVEDKRLFVVESEFANVLAQGRRDGNTLSAALRDLWDGGSIRPATKTSRLWATDPHIALYGNITPTELREKLSGGDMTNGLGNRFLVAWAERTGLVALPQPTPAHSVAVLAQRLEEVIRWAKGDYPTTKRHRPVKLSAEAQERYCEAYPELRRREPLGEHVSAMLERRAPIALRMAALFAVTDMTQTIEMRHLESALAWAEYHRESVIYIFGAGMGQREQAVRAAELREKLLTWLGESEVWHSRTEIQRGAYRNRATKDELNTAIQAALTDGLVEQRVTEKTRDNPRGKTEYRLNRPANIANIAKIAPECGPQTCEQPAKFANIANGSETKLRKVRNASQTLEPAPECEVREIRKVREPGLEIVDDKGVLV